MQLCGRRQVMRQSMRSTSTRQSASLMLQRNLDAPANIKIGTCAWSYEDWRGVFYPEHLPAGERLEFYARHFPAVEVDSTFYHAPTPHVAAHWAEVTPPDFAFSCKLPREITHERKLRDSAEAL